MKISKAALVEMLSKETEPLEVTLDCISFPQLKKTGNPYKDRKVTKETTLSGKIGKNYNTEKTILAEKEGKNLEESGYTAQPRTWGILINPYVVEHKGTYYLQVFVDKSSEPVYKIDDVVYDVCDLEDWLPKKAPQEIVIRDIKFENIKKLILKSQEYMIE